MHTGGAARRGQQWAVATAAVATSLFTLGGVCRSTGDAEEARGHYEAAIALLRKLFGGVEAVHDDIAASLAGLAGACADLGDLTAAREHYAAALAIKRKIHRSGGGVVGGSGDGIGEIDGDDDGEGGEQAKGEGGPPHEDIAELLGCLGRVSVAQRDYVVAGKLLREAWAMMCALYGSSHPRAVAARKELDAAAEAYR